MHFKHFDLTFACLLIEIGSSFSDGYIKSQSIMRFLLLVLLSQNRITKTTRIGQIIGNHLCVIIE